MIEIHIEPVKCHFCGEHLRADSSPVLMQGPGGLVGCCLKHLFIVSDEFRIQRDDYDERVRELYAEAMFPTN